MDLKLSGVNKTLLLPLCGRYLHSMRKDCEFYDIDAVTLVDALQLDVKNLLNAFNELESCYFLDRALTMDVSCQAYLKEFPYASIINIGAGLDTAFSRNDNGKLSWYELDMPNVIEIREKLLNCNERQHLLKASVFDLDWCDEVDVSQGVLLLCSGVLNYFPLSQVLALINQLALRFKGGQMLMDVMGDPIGVFYANKMVKKSNAQEAKIQWYLNKRFDDWSKEIKQVEFIDFYRQLPASLKLKFITRVKINLTQFLKSAQYCKLQF